MKQPTSEPESLPTCPNCAQCHGAHDRCLLEVLLGALEQRLAGERDLTDADIAAIYAAVDPDESWQNFGGPGVDYLEAHLTEPTTIAPTTGSEPVGASQQ